MKLLPRLIVLCCALVAALPADAQKHHKKVKGAKAASAPQAQKPEAPNVAADQAATAIPLEPSLHAKMKKRKKVVIVPAPPPPGPDNGLPPKR